MSPRLQRLVLACDIDGVLYDFEGTARRLLRERGFELDRPSNYWDEIKDRVSSDNWNWLFTSALSRLFLEGPTYPGVVEELNQIKETWDIVLVSSRPRRATGHTLDWVRAHKLPVIGVVCATKDKQRIQADMYLDDDPKVLEGILPWEKRLLWTRSWNSGVFYRPSTQVDHRRVTSWEDARRELRARRSQLLDLS